MECLRLSWNCLRCLLTRITRPSQPLTELLTLYTLSVAAKIKISLRMLNCGGLKAFLRVTLGLRIINTLCMRIYEMPIDLSFIWVAFKVHHQYHHIERRPPLDVVIQGLLNRSCGIRMQPISSHLIRSLFHLVPGLPTLHSLVRGCRLRTF